ncbi:MAG: hypothetical protein GX639_11455 [Fibrobacter sp.]|nr:hypothetical protein [Fibrobacter sp.]
MRKTIIILLVLIAIPLYSYNVYVLIKGSLKGTQETSTMQINGKKATVSIENLRNIVEPVIFVKKGRSPFVEFTVTEKTTVETRQVQIKKPVKAVAEMPKITINGIMWNPQNPLAMLGLPDGSSTVVKAGQKIGEFTVKKIEKTRVVVMVGKREVVLTR